LKESAVLIGKAGTLAGIVTDPDENFDSRQRPAILLLNAGLLHRVGPNRIYVQLARALASVGFVTLRLDFSAIGDSQLRRDNLTREESSISEGREAMDFLAASRGIKRFVLIGLCGGAINGFRITRHDPRVIGAVLIDGHAYRTLGFHVRHCCRHFFNPRKWWNLVAGKSKSGRKLRRMLGMGIAERVKVNPVGASYVRSPPPKDVMLADLTAMTDRGVQFYFIYSEGGMEPYFNYESQFGDMFPSLRSCDNLRVKLFLEADHTFTLLSHQKILIEDMVEWVSTTCTASK